MTRPAIPLLAAIAAAYAAAGGPAVTPAAGRAKLDGVERAVIRHVNAFRGRHGLPRVRPSRSLSRAADRHSRDMLARDFFAHFSSDGTSFDRRVRRYAGADAVGETLAVLPNDTGGAAAIVRMWIASPPHRAVLLTGRFQRIGVARRRGSLGGGRRSVVTADFASTR
jgi:uncharacterized protein YkwD